MKMVSSGRGKHPTAYIHRKHSGLMKRLSFSEPCIRGHRSSKCAHYDRLMVSVGKAGRPLSKCPHVEGSCNCKKLGAFMVAIPKGKAYVLLD